MATKKKYEAPAVKSVSKSLAKVEKAASLASIDAIAAGATKLWQAFANSLSTLTPEQFPDALNFIKTTEKLAGDAYDIVKPTIVDLVLKKGKKETDAGTKRLAVGGYELEVQPMGSGVDHKKLEALLRAKSVPVTDGMDTVVTYKTNESKVAVLVATGVLTQEELATCMKEASWKLMSPKKLEE